jgi:hypothetical protein
VEDEARARKGGINLTGEHQWVTAVPGKHWIGVQRELGRLATVGSRGGGGPARKLSSGNESAVEKKCGNAYIRSQSSR